MSELTGKSSDRKIDQSGAIGLKRFPKQSRLTRTPASLDFIAEFKRKIKRQPPKECIAKPNTITASIEISSTKKYVNPSQKLSNEDRIKVDDFFIKYFTYDTSKLNDKALKNDIEKDVFKGVLQVALEVISNSPESSDNSIVDLLIKCGANVNKSFKNVTPLGLALEKRNTSAVRLLIAAKADVNRSSGGNSPLLIAYRTEDNELVSLLEKNKAVFKKSNFLQVKTVNDNVFRGSKPTIDYQVCTYTDEVRYELMHKGVTLVVSLNEHDTPEGVDKLKNIKLVHEVTKDFKTPSAIKLLELANVILNNDHGKTYIHCGAGLGRTGTMVTAYEIVNGAIDTQEELEKKMLANDVEEDIQRMHLTVLFNYINGKLPLNTVDRFHAESNLCTALDKLMDGVKFTSIIDCENKTNFYQSIATKVQMLSTKRLNEFNMLIESLATKEDNNEQFKLNKSEIEAFIGV